MDIDDEDNSPSLIGIFLRNHIQQNAPKLRVLTYFSSSSMKSSLVMMPALIPSRYDELTPNIE
jgi:hypothetical protein